MHVFRVMNLVLACELLEHDDSSFPAHSKYSRSAKDTSPCLASPSPSSRGLTLAPAPGFNPTVIPTQTCALFVLCTISCSTTPMRNEEVAIKTLDVAANVFQKLLVTPNMSAILCDSSDRSVFKYTLSCNHHSVGCLSSGSATKSPMYDDLVHAVLAGNKRFPFLCLIKVVSNVNEWSDGLS